MALDMKTKKTLCTFV